MQKSIVAVCILALVSGACNTQNAATENQLSPENSALTLADVIPVLKTTSLQTKAAQEEELQEDLKRFKSRKMATAYYVNEAQRTYNDQKTDSAIYLFGKAWQMDSTNFDVYRGYGILYGEQKAYDKALFILYYALKKDPENPLLLKAVATSHLGHFYEKSDPRDLFRSRKLLQKVIKLNPDGADAYYKLAITHYYLSAYNKAWKYLHQSILHDKAVADQTFITALLEKEQDPKGVYRDK